MYIIEAFFCPGEIDYAEAACEEKATFILFGIDAYVENRLKWMNESSEFKPVPVANAALLYATECRNWFEAKEWEPNINACLERVSENNHFYNDGEGFVKKILVEAIARVDEVLVTPP